MKALAVQMRKAWIAHYKALYPDFAEHLNQYTSMEFADSVPKKAAVKAANKLIREWEASSDAIERVTKRSKQIIAKMLKRSIKLEAKAINGKADLTQEALDNWMEGQVAKLIRNTHDTVKDELHTFLVPKIRDGLSPQEIAKGVREHFSDFPGWKASRVARSETRDVVNAGTLLTGRAQRPEVDACHGRRGVRPGLQGSQRQAPHDSRGVEGADQGAQQRDARLRPHSARRLLDQVGA
jgi:hypothetical protein